MRPAPLWARLLVAICFVPFCFVWAGVELYCGAKRAAARWRWWWRSRRGGWIV